MGNLVKFSHYKEFNESYSGDCFINIDEISSIEPYIYHSFRNPISKIILKNGTHKLVWENTEEVSRKIAMARI